jgi:hypothetical protein
MLKQTFPDFVPPMMAESAKTPFDSPECIFEIKLDGYRAITVFDSTGKTFECPNVGFLDNVLSVLIPSDQPASKVIGGIQMRQE